MTGAGNRARDRGSSDRFLLFFLYMPGVRLVLILVFKFCYLFFPLPVLALLSPPTISTPLSLTLSHFTPIHSQSLFTQSSQSQSRSSFLVSFYLPLSRHLLSLPTVLLQFTTHVHLLHTSSTAPPFFDRSSSEMVAVTKQTKLWTRTDARLTSHSTDKEDSNI